MAAALTQLQGCMTVAATHELLTARSDYRLDYDILVRVESRQLRFKGSTECKWNIALHAASAYATTAPEPAVWDSGEKWLLDHVDCNAVLIRKQPMDYRLYRIRSQTRAQLYHLPPQSVKASFSGQEQPAREQARHSPESYHYNAGPYAYTKVVYEDAPEPFRGYSETLAVEVPAHCAIPGQSGTGVTTVPLTRKNFSPGVNPRVVEVEEGFMRYDESLRAWIPVPGADRYGPLDVVRRDADRSGCLVVRVDERSLGIGTSKWSDIIYAPQHRAVYRITRVSGIADGGDWRRCEKPSGIHHLPAGVSKVYKAGPGQLDHFVRQNPDGTFSCSVRVTY